MMVGFGTFSKDATAEERTKSHGVEFVMRPKWDKDRSIKAQRDIYVIDKAKSLESGKEVYEEELCVRQVSRLSETFIPLSSEDDRDLYIKRFPIEWAQFQSLQKIKENGWIPLDRVNELSTTDVQKLKALGVFAVEQVLEEKSRLEYLGLGIAVMICLDYKRRQAIEKIEPTSSRDVQDIAKKKKVRTSDIDKIKDSVEK